MTGIELLGTRNVVKRGRSKRTSFGMVHYVTGNRQAYLIIPESSGISVGDRISFYVDDASVSFRVEADGDYTVFKQTIGSSSMRCTLCPKLQDYAAHKVKDIIARRRGDATWTVPLSQFE